VPPHTATTGLASLVLQGFAERLALVAEERWLVVGNDEPHRVRIGTVIVITEEPKPVGYFHVEEIRQPE
jgi:hypothetical protein